MPVLESVYCVFVSRCDDLSPETNQSALRCPRYRLRLYCIHGQYDLAINEDDLVFLGWDESCVVLVIVIVNGGWEFTLSSRFCFPHPMTLLGSARRLIFVSCIFSVLTPPNFFRSFVILPCESQDCTFEGKRNHMLYLDMRMWPWLEVIAWSWISVGDRVSKLYVLLTD